MLQPVAGSTEPRTARDRAVRDDCRRLLAHITTTTAAPAPVILNILLGAVLDEIARTAGPQIAAAALSREVDRLLSAGRAGYSPPPPPGPPAAA